MCYPCTMCGKCGKPRSRFVEGRCPVCGHLGENGAKTCEACGAPFPPEAGQASENFRIKKNQHAE